MTNVRLLLLAALLFSVPLRGEDRPSTTANDASCDIATLPAATLLVPYFEVEVDLPRTTATTTLITVTNVSREPQIAQVTIWTDLDYPIFNFPIFLTGYDVSSLNLYDILVRGTIEPDGRTTSRTTPGQRSRAITPLGNPRFLPSAAATCATLPGTVPQQLQMDVLRALTTGSLAGCKEPVGRRHPGLAIGYVTVDLVATCTSRNALQQEFWDELLYDNVLTGGWQIVRLSMRTGHDAGGEPAVHIRAVPEGGKAGAAVASPLPFTFYDRFTPAARRRVDRRQPLPSTFAARFIEGGTGNFTTDLAIWREGTGGSSCTLPAENDTGWVETVRFDERENPTIVLTDGGTLPVTTSIDTSSDVFPPRTSDLGGWLYLNLNNGGSERYSAAGNFDLTADSSTLRGPRQSQAWVISRMNAEDRYAIAIQATALGNGCSPSPASFGMATADATIRPIGPALDRGDTTVLANMTHRNDDSCDISVQPAATLLLPYFEVDVTSPPDKARTTLFTVTNVTDRPRVARVTLWTDYAYPALTFNIYLTGYDLQSVNLQDVLVRGQLPGSGWLDAPNGERSLPMKPAGCARLPSAIPPAALRDAVTALTAGLHSYCPDPIGQAHANAIGYATIDLVAGCTAETPIEWGYYDRILFDNVLTGDYQLIFPDRVLGGHALGNPLVHIRAIPEGGEAGEQRPTRLASTFYGRYQHATSPGRDRRQPLPSAFAAHHSEGVRWVQGEWIRSDTDFLVWREGRTGAWADCDKYLKNGALPLVETVRFDERENPFTNIPDASNFPAPEVETAATNRLASTNDLFPPLESGDTAGWMYVNLGRSREAPAVAQAWLTILTFVGSQAVAYDATAFGNGCSPVAPYTADSSSVHIEPAPND